MKSLDVDLVVRSGRAALRLRTDRRTLWVTPLNWRGLGLIRRGFRAHGSGLAAARDRLADFGLGVGLRLGPLRLGRLRPPGRS